MLNIQPSTTWTFWNFEGILNSFHPYVNLRLSKNYRFIYYFHFIPSKGCSFLKTWFFQYPIYFDSSFDNESFGIKQCRGHVYRNIFQCDLISSIVKLPTKAISLHPYLFIRINLCKKRNIDGTSSRSAPMVVGLLLLPVPQSAILYFYFILKINFLVPNSNLK